MVLSTITAMTRPLCVVVVFIVCPFGFVMLVSLYQLFHSLSSYLCVTFVTLSVSLLLGVNLDNSSVQQYRTDVKSIRYDISHTTQANKVLATVSTRRSASHLTSPLHSCKCNDLGVRFRGAMGVGVPAHNVCYVIFGAGVAYPTDR